MKSSKNTVPLDSTSRRSHIWGVTLAVPATLLLICACSFFLRTYFLHDRVFVGDQLRLQDNDPWCHYRVLQWQVKNLPFRFMHDPYAIFPGGQGVPVGPFFDLSIASVLWLLTAGSPSQSAIDAAAAYAAPILAVLVCLVTYAAGRVLFGRAAGLVAAAAIGLLPGTYFVRSSLGFLDHHVMEVLLSTAVLWLLATALARSGKSGENPRWQRRVIVPSIMAGVALGCYLLTWVGGNFLLVILIAWIVVQHFREQLAGDSGGHFSRIAMLCFAAALLTVLFYRDYAWHRLQVHGLLGGIALCVLMAGLARIVRGRPRGGLIFLAVVVGGGLSAVGATFLFDPDLAARIVNEFGRLAPDATARTITEARPIIWTNRGYSIMPLWEIFGLTFPIALVGLAMLIVQAVRRPASGNVVMLVWSTIVLAAMFGQARFSYYAAPVVALLVGWVCQESVMLAWTVQKPPRTKGRPVATNHWTRAALAGTVGAAISAAAFVPLLLRLPQVVSFYDGPTSQWCEALTWLRDNSPEPFGDEAAYFAASNDSVFENARESATAYGVMSWWDYGYWISGLARRVPNSNPTQAGAVDSARFMLAQTEDEAAELLNACRARHVILDWLLPRWEKPNDLKVRGKFAALPIWLNRPLSDYYERATQVNEKGQKVTRFIYYPAYFQTMLVRLFIFSAGQVGVAPPVNVYTLGEETNAEGRKRKIVTSFRQFDTYEDAKAFVEAANDPATVIASESPFMSCVPMPALKRFRLVHQSPTNVATIHGRKVSPVRIFEYSPTK